MVGDYDREDGLGLQSPQTPFRDDSETDSGDEGSQDSISVFRHDDGTHSRNFSPSLISPTMEKDVLHEIS